MMRAASPVSAGGVAARLIALRRKHSHKVFRFRISAALELKFCKRAKAQPQRSQRRSAKRAKTIKVFLRGLRVTLATFAVKALDVITRQVYLGGSASILSRMPTVSSTVLPTISRLFGLSLSTVSWTVCQNTSL